MISQGDLCHIPSRSGSRSRVSSTRVSRLVPGHEITPTARGENASTSVLADSNSRGAQPFRTRWVRTEHFCVALPMWEGAIQQSISPSLLTARTNAVNKTTQSAPPCTRGLAREKNL